MASLAKYLSRTVSLALATLLGASTLSAQANKPSAAETQLLVKPRASMSEVALHALLSAKGAREHGDIPALNVRIIRVPAKASAALLEALKRNADVEYAEPDYIATKSATANDPYYTNGSAWHLAKIQAPSAWDLSTGSQNVVIAVLDSGASAAHPDLKNKLLPGYDFINNDNNPDDDNGHGTAVAGVAAPSTNNAVGVAGVAWANPILPVKVLGADGSGNYSAIANGITYAADRGARIINMSLGGTSSSRTLQDAVNYAWKKNCVLIAAAGNNGNDTAVYPAACANVVAVSATNSSDTRPSWSNYGSYVDLSAPGVNIVSLQGTNSYAGWNGTSFSSPVVAGVAALMASANPNLTNTELVNLLLKNTNDIGAAGYDVYYGSGRVNAYLAVSAASATVVTDTSAPAVQISSPDDGATVSGTISVNTSATDNVGVTKLELYINNALVAQSTNASATFSVNSLNYADGAHALAVRGYDAAGNVGTTSIIVTVQNSTTADTIAPVAQITSPADGSQLARSQKINVAGTDNVAVTAVELYINGKFFGRSTSASAVFSWNTSKVAKGSHTLQAFAYDAAGNVGASTVITVLK